jgi:hypothetical protein
VFPQSKNPVHVERWLTNEYERYSGKGAFQNAVLLIAPFNASAPLAKSQVFKAHRLWYHSTLGLRVMMMKKKPRFANVKS